MDKYGYIGIETLLNFCENSKDHSVTPNDFMGMKRVRMPKRKTGRWIFVHPLQDNDSGAYMCSVCKTGDFEIKPTDKYCKFCGAKMGEDDVDALTDEIMERYCNECDNHRCKDCKHLQKWRSEESAKKFN